MSEDNSRSGGTSAGSGGNARSSFTLSAPDPRLFARGGLTGAGELFRAGEGGKYEVIGNYGGSTTVMPLENTGFVQAMYSAIFEAVTDAQGWWTTYSSPNWGGYNHRYSCIRNKQKIENIGCNGCTRIGGVRHGFNKDW